MPVHPDGLFLNSIPKSGTVLLNNIIEQFVGLEDKIIKPWLATANMGDPAFSTITGKFFVGHLTFSSHTWWKVKGCRQILLVRNPKDVCISYARFYASKDMAGRSRLSDFILRHQPSLSVVLRIMLTGWQIDGERHPPVLSGWKDIVRWAFIPGVMTVTYEELIARLKEIESDKSAAFFRAILQHGGLDIDAFPDWRDRVMAGSDGRKSMTFSGNLAYLIPTEGFPSAEDLAMLDVDYHEACAMYERIFLHREPA